MRTYRKLTEMRRQIRILTASIATALLGLGLGLPGLAMATATDYFVVPDGTVNVTLIPFGPLSGLAASYQVRIEGGKATFDPETGVLSSLSIDTGRRTFGLRSLNVLAGSLSLPLDWTGGPIPTVVIAGQDLIVRYDFDFKLDPPPAVTSAVPEPTAALLFGVGVVAVGTARRRQATR